MNKKLFTSSLLIVLILVMLSTSVYATHYDIKFGGVGPGASTLDLITPISGYPVVTSSYNEPRDIGTNPHNGIDIRAYMNTRVNAICDGWVTHQNDTSTYYLRLRCDVNGNGVNDDDLEIYYNHLEDVGFVSNNVYISAGTKVAESGDENGAVAPHLHFGTRTYRSGTYVWMRNEPYYRWTSNWNYGKDLDFISYAAWTNDVASVNAYAYTVGTKVPLNYGDVDLYHRLDGNVAWQGPVNMSKSGDTYSYDLDNIYDNNDVIHWMVRARRPGLSGYDVAFMIPKFRQPDSNPNATSYKYAYYKCTMGGTCTAVE